MQGKKLNLAGKLVLITGALVTGLATIVGCGSTGTYNSWPRQPTWARRNEGFILGGIAGGIGSYSDNLAKQGKVDRAVQGYRVENTLNTLAQQQANLAAAREGRSDVNVTVNVPGRGQGYQQNIEDSPIAFTCNYWNDDDCNGSVCLKEFKGKKEVFKNSEQVMVVGYLNNSQQVNVKYTITDLDRNRVLKKDSIDIFPHRTMTTIAQPYSLEVGKYGVILILSNGKGTSCEFEVTK